jgi:transposase-like protein
MGPRKQHTAAFKAQVAIAAIQGYQTLNEVASTYGVHPVQVALWKRQALAALPEVFASRRGRAAEEAEALQARLYQEIGQLKVELDWLKRKARWVS